LSNEFINRTKLIDKKLISLDIFENRIRFCDDETKKKYLTKRKNPLLNGPFCGQIKNGFSTSIQHEKTYKKNNIFINKIQDIFLYNKISKKNNSNSPKLEENTKTFDKKLLVTTFLFNLISQFSLMSSLNSHVPYLFTEPEQVNQVCGLFTVIIKLIKEIYLVYKYSRLSRTIFSLFILVSYFLSTNIPYL